MPGPWSVAHQLTDGQRRRGGLTRQAQLRSEREERRPRFEAVLDPELEALADALVAKALVGDVAALREAIHQLVGRPETVVSHEQDPDRPIRIVVESISSRRREALADVEAEDAEVEALPDV